MLRRLLGYLRTRSETHLFLARDLSLDVVPQPSDAASLARVASTGDAHFPDLARFCESAGFGAGWAADMLGDSAIALIACDGPGGTAMAMAWSTVHPFPVEEIHATFDPGGAPAAGAAAGAVRRHAGVYLFGDFVAPEHRGKKLQRLLVNARLLDARRERPDLRYAYTIIHASNATSLRSYQAEHFAVAHALCQTLRRGVTRSTLTNPRGHAGALLKLAAPDRITAID